MSDFHVAEQYFMEDYEVIEAFLKFRKQFLKKFGYVPTNIVMHEEECNSRIMNKLTRLRVSIVLSRSVQRRHLFFPVIIRKPKRFLLERVSHG